MKILRIEPPEISIPCKLGIISDTHVNGRSSKINPRVFDVFRINHVSAILHLGDITNYQLISDLNHIAQTYTVRGNRDLFLWPRLPFAIEFNIDGVRIGMTHGHGTTLRYLWDKMHYVFVGFKFERYRKLLDEIFPEADIKLFGHTHVAFSRKIDKTTYFNPGAASNISMHDPHPSVGILTINSAYDIQSEVVIL
jgi:hypothetical protein